MVSLEPEVIPTPKTLTKTQPPSGTRRKTPKDKVVGNGTKIPIRATLPDETDPEMLRAYRLLVKAAAAVRENLANMETESGDKA